MDDTEDDRSVGVRLFHINRWKSVRPKIRIHLKGRRHLHSLCA